MKAFIKSFLITTLSLSNLFVFGFVVNVYFGATSSPIEMFSRSENAEDLKDKIKQECETSFQEVLSGQKRSFICTVNLKQKHKGVSYELRTRFKVLKEGDTLTIKDISRKVRGKKAHITEAEFCDDCLDERILTDDSVTDIKEFMKEISSLAETVYEQDQEALQKAYEEHSAKSTEKKRAEIKVQKCEGIWNPETEEFEEFIEVEEKLNCRLSQMDDISNPFELEGFYHKELKRELWRLALSDENNELLDEDLFNSFNDPYRYALSVRSSTELLKNYTRWKDDFDVLDSLKDKQNFIKSLEDDVKYITGFMTKQQSEQDIYYLNTGFDELFNSTVNISKIINDNKLKPSDFEQEGLPSNKTNIPLNYEKLGEELGSVYQR